MRHNIPYRDAAGAGSNPAIAGLLLSAQMRSLMFEVAEIAQAIYRDEVSQRTGRLARSARVETFRGGRLKDRWKSRLVIGGSEAPHGLSHEFGYEIHDDDGNVTAVVGGAHDLNQVLNRLGTL
ncbi:hypothetical protein IU459_27025 [Nocardia amamiensis]|uniref:Uncharacterized protein n=1 Tax=Nocardia amamiensis TaxID=404578 RepID=A0ABS0D222_9NOCA|nr:hypothetical protein [Nocardia amamiensis]MBF6301169.1 hypothetical protein [Nocardia amamiensis]